MTKKKPYLIESIKVHNNEIYNLDYHIARIARALRTLYGSKAVINFDLIKEEVHKQDSSLYKLRIVYNDSFLKYELLPYAQKPVESLQLISSNKIEYSHKYQDRLALDKLYSLKRNADDILIVKNGMVTDTFYCNVALLKGGQWLSPKVPLLKGTKRQQLIDDKQITEAIIHLDDLLQFERIRLFNAMIEFGAIDLDVRQII